MSRDFSLPPSRGLFDAACSAVVRTTAEQAASNKPHGNGNGGKEKSRDITRLEEELSDILATQVAIKTGAKNRGQLVINFSDLDALDGVIARLRGEAVEQ